MDKLNKLEVTKLEDIDGGEIVELPPFNSGKPFNAKLKSPSILTLCATGVIPNELLQEAMDIYEGKDMQPGHIKQYGEVMIAVAKATLIEPEYESIKDYLNSRQLISIYNYAQAGVRALIPFSQIEKLLKTGDTVKSDTKATKRDIKDKK
ncbi:MAG: hypothetical protein ACYDIA_01710 [Candidatus Humimicrobiaceae bacterium]